MKTMRISKHCQVRYAVQLPKPGNVHVLTGDEVKYGDVLAEAKLPERFLVYDVVNQLKMAPREADEHIEKRVGESFIAGDVIALKPGIFSRLFRARQNGKVVSIRDGKVVLALGETSEVVAAPFPGLITELIHERGAVIAAVGAVVEGVLAGEKEVAGELVFPSLELDRRKRLLDEDTVKGNICFCETLTHPQMLKVLIEAGALGLVLGSISPAVYTSLRNSEIPWLLLAGFGSVEVDRNTLAVLETMEDDLVYLVRSHDNQPAMLLCIAEDEPKTQELLTQPKIQELKVGSKVKLWIQPYQGRVGEVIELPEHSEESACGGRIVPVVVKLTDELIVRVPEENLLKLLE